MTIDKMTASELDELSRQHDTNEDTLRAIVRELLGRYVEIYTAGRDAGGRGGLESSDARNHLRRVIESLPWEPRK